jgi:hypothetical protein
VQGEAVQSVQLEVGGLLDLLTVGREARQP